MNKKLIAASLLGLLVGAIFGFFAFRIGVKQGLQTMYKQVEMDFEVVETRLQTMADEALTLRKMLSRKGWRGDPSPFLDVEEKRSWLHGSLRVPMKM